MMIEYCDLSKRLLFKKNNKIVAQISKDRKISKNENQLTLIDIKFLIDLSNEPYWPKSKDNKENFFE